MKEIISLEQLEDIDLATHKVGLPVGSRINRSQDKKEWYVLLNFLKTAIPSELVELPFAVWQGTPPYEPDFIVARESSVIENWEITEATALVDQREMTLFEQSGKEVMLLGDFGGRFKDGTSRPDIAWAEDIADAIKRKNRKAIFESSIIDRHLIIYPNSNASFLLFDEDHERVAINYLRTEIIKNETTFTEMANGCLVHILGKFVICFDLLGEMKLFRRPTRNT